MPAVADVSTAPNAIAGASAAKNRKKTDAYDATERAEMKKRNGQSSGRSPRRGARRFRCLRR
jgi:hypothetical protein